MRPVPNLGKRFCSVSQVGFTLIELLVVIAIIAILAIVVVLTLNPVQLLQQSRDSNRLSDLADIQTAVNLLLTDQPGASLGSALTIYVSIPDSVATTTAGDQCQGLGLPSLPSGYAYHCAASSTYRNINGTGWIPASLSSVSTGSPLPSLPIDPTNTSSSRLYYTYVTNGTQYEITANMESQRYKLGGSNDAVGPDGSNLASVVAKGTNLSLEPLDYGDTSLIGYWTLDEGSGSTAYDYSGTGNVGTWGGTAAGTSGYYSSGLIGPYAGFFNGTNDIVSTTAVNGFSNTAITMSFWLNETSYPADYSEPVSLMQGAGRGISQSPTSHALFFDLAFTTAGFNETPEGAATVPTLGVWNFYAATWASGKPLNMYQNGVLIATSTVTTDTMTAPTAMVIGKYLPNHAVVNGLIDDVRVYNRALSASEIQAMYNGGK